MILDSYEKLDDDEAPAGDRGFQTMIAARGFDDEVAAIMCRSLIGPDYDPDRWITKWRIRPPASWAFSYHATFDRDNIVARLDEIRLPALVLQGEGNPAHGPEVLRDPANRIGAGATTVTIPGAGHASNLEQPARVNGELAVPRIRPRAWNDRKSDNEQRGRTGHAQTAR